MTFLCAARSKAKQDIKNLDDRTPRTVAEVNNHAEILGLFDKSS